MGVKIGIVYQGDGLFRKYMFSKYRSSLRSGGAEVKVLPWIKSSEEAQRELQGCSGLLLPGGKDIDPALYGEERMDCCGETSPERDICEPLYFKAARSAGMPVLGICRGFQMINVLMGGSLWQDLSLRSTKSLNHRSFKKRAGYVHEVNIAPDSLLGDICYPLHSVNSIHHQGVKELSPDLKADAYSTDGLCEAFQGKNGPFLLAVQWHPEHLYRRDRSARDIFRIFIEAASDIS